MQITVLIEPVPKKGFRARTGEPLALSAKGGTREEALRNLESAVRKRLRKGSELTTLDMAPATETNPWVKFAGMFKDNPMFDEVLEIMAENRRKDDADTDNP